MKKSLTGKQLLNFLKKLSSDDLKKRVRIEYYPGIEPARKVELVRGFIDITGISIKDQLK